MKDYNEPSEETKNEWENDPDNWIWGMFYYNPKDKRSYIPRKPKELGWHSNYADPDNIIIIAIIVAMIMILVLIKHDK
ncbi:hypothetical protein [Flavobacterium granuli]|uniref:Membrane protein n=1 Tax=Flavobacterium granuli TaxID=280093 RepID=A0ABU1S660_9FLAO|nr:hypothetical protein [Flavobacterium granuli]MDR6845614.1 putative membrane protein [Flavobacterium granuli]